MLRFSGDPPESSQSKLSLSMPCRLLAPNQLLQFGSYISGKNHLPELRQLTMVAYKAPCHNPHLPSPPPRPAKLASPFPTPAHGWLLRRLPTQPGQRRSHLRSLFEKQEIGTPKHDAMPFKWRAYLDRIPLNPKQRASRPSCCFAWALGIRPW